MKKIKIAVLMDDISSINPKKDSSLAMMLEANRRSWDIYTFDTHDMFVKDAEVFTPLLLLFILFTIVLRYQHQLLFERLLSI